ncbi:hypothetical protein VTJ49DRAFT_5721 [Mycothermus thermophilus]|uniref:N-acetylglucosamine-6-phosphate deacetylase n=1 Tax=Humicola insolens TaxID=85995 RepID=A0ABR3VK18_HUMIN
MSPPTHPPPPRSGITKFTNCLVLRGNSLVRDDIWISSVTGKIVDAQSAFYDSLVVPDTAIDLGGRIVSPGFIDCQLNGAFGFNFSTLTDDYADRLRELNKKLIKTGVTSYLPTLTSQTSELYKKVLPHLSPSGTTTTTTTTTTPRNPLNGAESLGAHAEGPFLNPLRNGVHNPSALRTARSFTDLEDVYGAENLRPTTTTPAETGKMMNVVPPTVRMITLAPEVGGMMRVIPKLVRRGIVVSMGHSEASYEQAKEAVGKGVRMVTHLLNAMRGMQQREPGILGVLGAGPYFGLVCDGVHLHPATVKLAWNIHPEGLILVTDAMHVLGLPDGRYPWTNGEGEHWIVKKGRVLELEGTGSIAGSSSSLVECIETFLRHSGAPLPLALRAVTATPAAMLGLQGVKGTLDPGADADLVVLSFSESEEEEQVVNKVENAEEGTKSAAAETTPGNTVTTPNADGHEQKKQRGPDLVVEEVWKFGVRVYRREE